MKFSEFILEGGLNEAVTTGWGDYYTKYFDTNKEKNEYFKYKRKVAGAILDDIKKMLRPIKDEYESIHIDVGPQRTNKVERMTPNWRSNLGVRITIRTDLNARTAIYVPDGTKNPMRNITGRFKDGVSRNFSQTDPEIRQEAQRIYKDVKACIKSGGDQFSLKYNSWIIGLDNENFYKNMWAHEQTSKDPYFMKPGDVLATIIINYNVIIKEGTKLEKDLYFATQYSHNDQHRASKEYLEMSWKHHIGEISDDEWYDYVDKIYGATK